VVSSSRKRANAAGWSLARSFLQSLPVEGPSLFGSLGGVDAAAEVAGSVAAAPPPLALSLVHTLTEESENVGSFRVEIAEGGTAVRVRQIQEKREKKTRLMLPKRGLVRGMSAASGRRAEFFLRSVDRSKVTKTFFITQTAGPEFLGVGEWSAVESARRAWERRFESKYGKDAAFCFWKKEPHPSDGRPHLHRLLMWIVPSPGLQDFRDWDDQAWADSLGAPLKRVRCRVEEVRTWAGVSCYLRKYIAKPVGEEEYAGEPTGKCWDVRWRKNAPVNIREEVVPEAVGKKYLRTLRKLQSRKREKWYYRLPFFIGGYQRLVFFDKGLIEVGGQAPRMFSNLPEQMRYCRESFDWRFKRSRPACMVCRVVQCWSVDSDTGRLEPSGKPLVDEKGNEVLGEVQTRAFSVHFVPDDQAQKLLTLCKETVAGVARGDLTTCEKRWAREAGGRVEPLPF
jgi:hypothetical protein